MQRQMNEASQRLREGVFRFAWSAIETSPTSQDNVLAAILRARDGVFSGLDEKAASMRFSQ